MIERFNFYDVYGYLIPGAVWLGLLAVPFVLAGAIPNLGATALTAVGLVGGYVAGHFLGGLARKVVPSRKYGTSDGKPRQFSDLLLDPQYNEDDALAPKVWDLLKEHVHERYRLDISNADERKGVFFLCRTALAQGKVGSYVEQYQGMLSLTRSLAAGCIFAVAFYAGWMLAFWLQPVRSAWDRIFSGYLPVLAALVPFILILLLDKDSRKALNVWKVIRPEKKVLSGEEATDKVENSAKQPDWKKYLCDAAESVIFAALLCAIGFVAEGWFNFSEARTYQLAAASSILLLAVPRFLGASDNFDKSLATSVFRDFIVLSTGKAVPPEAASRS